MKTITKVTTTLLRCCPAVFTLTILISCTSTGPGDYGDAPDGTSTGYPALFAQTGDFPTLSASNGAVATDVSQATLGPTSSVEQDANDAADPDGVPNLDPSNTDSDDGIVSFVLLLTSIPPPAVMAVSVNAPQGSAAGTYYINAVIDLDMDGNWGGTVPPGIPEWVVQNFPVALTAGRSATVELPPFYYGNGNRLPDSTWMRILLSKERVTVADWTGSGQFSAGEVEDHVIDLPRFKDSSTIVKMKCPLVGNVVVFPRGALVVPFSCEVNNSGPNAGNFTYTLVGVTNPRSVTVFPGLPGGPGGPVRGGPVPIGRPGAGRAAVPPEPVTLNFLAFRNPGDLPSHWIYSAQAVDPPSVVHATGVTVGYGFSKGEFDFVAVDIESEGTIVEIREDIVLIEVVPTDEKYDEKILVGAQPGKDFRGLTFEYLVEHGLGSIEIPPFKE